MQSSHPRRRCWCPSAVRQLRKVEDWVLLMECRKIVPEWRKRLIASRQINQSINQYATAEFPWAGRKCATPSTVALPIPPSAVAPYRNSSEKQSSANRDHECSTKKSTPCSNVAVPGSAKISKHSDGLIFQFLIFTKYENNLMICASRHVLCSLNSNRKRIKQIPEYCSRKSTDVWLGERNNRPVGARDGTQYLHSTGPAQYSSREKNSEKNPQKKPPMPNTKTKTKTKTKREYNLQKLPQKKDEEKRKTGSCMPLCQ